MTSSPGRDSGEQVVVGVDFGSSRIKAAAYGRDGALVASTALPTPLFSGPEGDDFLVGGMLDAAQRAIAALRWPNRSVVGVAMTSMGEVGTVLSAGALADLAFPSWYDSRGAEVVEDLERRWRPSELRERTGGHLRIASTVAKLGHLARSGVTVPEGTFLGICGALAWQLTGEVWNEAGLATTGGVYDIHDRSYLHQVWAAAGLARVVPPPVRHPGAWSPATGDLAARLGIAEGAPVMIAGHDHPVAAVGAGITSDEVADSMGTGEAIIAVMQQAGPAEVRSRVADLLASDPYVSVEMWPPTGELLVVWERMRPGLAMRAFLDRAEVTREELDRLAPAPAVPLRMKDEMSLRLEAGRPLDVDYDAAMWGELVDLYVLLAQRGEALVREVTGAQGVRVLTGGGLRSPRWRAGKAALATRPIEVSVVQETATRGCAAMVGTACGWWTEPSLMPGAERIRVSPGSTADMDRAGRRLSDAAAE